MTPSESRTRRLTALLERKFVFRKLGLPYDYDSPADDFPRRAFGQPRDARAGLPNLHGFGAGFAFQIHHAALLADALLLRLELGLAGAEGEAALARLTDGLGRLFSAGPKGFLPRGLAADGRGYYAGVDASVAAAAAFALARALGSPALDWTARNALLAVAQRWIERLEQNHFRPIRPDGAPAARAETARPDPVHGPLLLALTALAQYGWPDPKRAARHAEFAAEVGGVRLAGLAPGELSGLSAWDALWRQAALHALRSLDPDPARKALAAERMRETALAAATHIGDWRKTRTKESPESGGGTAGAGAAATPPLSFDWRNFPRAPRGGEAAGGAPAAAAVTGSEAATTETATAPGCAAEHRAGPQGGGRRGEGRDGRGGRAGRPESAAEGTEDAPGFSPPPSWGVLTAEAEGARAALAAAAAVLLAEDRSLAEPLADDLRAMMGGVDWDAAHLCGTVALGLAVQTRGTEAGLWEAEAGEGIRMAPAKEESFVAKFLTPEYDAENPARAGHTGRPGGGKEGEGGEEEGKGGGRRRRRRRR